MERWSHKGGGKKEEKSVDLFSVSLREHFSLCEPEEETSAVATDSQRHTQISRYSSDATRPVILLIIQSAVCRERLLLNGQSLNRCLGAVCH